jgi:hypothetical protein
MTLEADVAQLRNAVQSLKRELDQVKRVADEGSKAVQSLKKELDQVKRVADEALRAAKSR